MQINSYIKYFDLFFRDPEMSRRIEEAVTLVRGVKRIFFLGNGGSNAICSHMMEDYGKIGGFRTFTFSDPALITCYANDYGYENAMMEWLKLHLDAGDLLIAVSSSGESKNIVNAARFASGNGAKLITLTGFKEGNTLSTTGDINFQLPVSNYGIVECYHQVILHIILDSLHG